MSLFTLWIESLPTKYRINENCVRTISSLATCDSCVRACPAEAIAVSEGTVRIEDSLCTDCGLCVPACPVFAVEGVAPKRERNGKHLVYTPDCPPTVKELLIYSLKGISSIASDSGEVNQTWQKNVSKANEIGKDLEIQQISVEKVERKETPITRRELFSKLVKGGKKVASELTPASWRMNHEELDLRKHYPNHQFYDIQVDVEKCTVCKSCELLCPQKAIQITNEHMVLQNHDCTCCGLCTDLCPEQAIEIKEKVREKVTVTIPLAKIQCESCGINFFTFRSDLKRCTICCRRNETYLPLYS